MSDSPGHPHRDLTLELAELRAQASSLRPIDIHARMDAIRGQADRAGLPAMVELARLSAQLALLPGARTATFACLDHAGEALAARTPAEHQAVLAAVAARLH